MVLNAHLLSLVPHNVLKQVPYYPMVGIISGSKNENEKYVCRLQECGVGDLVAEATRW